MKWQKVLVVSILVGCATHYPPAPVPEAEQPSSPASVSDPVPLPDMAKPFESSCGQPGDVGNSVGVGKFCSQQSDCPAGFVCTHLYLSSTYFCTKECWEPNGDAMCGENAICEYSAAYDTGGCVPTSCSVTAP